MTRSNRSLIEQLSIEIEKAARAGDHQTHAALHVVEMKLREARLQLLDARKTASREVFEQLEQHPLVGALLEAD